MSGAPLWANPRVVREGRTLAAAGYEVLSIGTTYSAAQYEQDRALAAGNGFRFESAVPAPDGPGGRASSLWRRARTRLAVELKRMGLEHSYQLGPEAAEIPRLALRTRADYYIAHLEQGCLAGVELLDSGAAVGADFEDWYSEDLLPSARAQRPIRLLRKLEGRLLREGGHATCPSRTMAAGLASEFGCEPPTTVYNALSWSERERVDGLSKDRRDRRLPSIHWFSQTLGPGRGLGDLLAALDAVAQPAEVHLRGRLVAGFEDWLRETTPEAWRSRIFLHPLVSNEELFSRIAEHDIGFAGEVTEIPSRDLTVTNKIVYYLLGGLAVAASATQGQREIAEAAPDAVALYPPGDSEALAAVLNRWLSSDDTRAAAKAAALQAAQTQFCWERQEPKLLEAVSRGIARGPQTARGRAQRPGDGRA